MLILVEAFIPTTSVPVLVALKSESAIAGMSSNTGEIKNAPPTAPTVNPSNITNKIFLLPINGVRSAVENIKTNTSKNSPNINITVNVSMF